MSLVGDLLPSCFPPPPHLNSFWPLYLTSLMLPVYTALPPPPEYRPQRVLHRSSPGPIKFWSPLQPHPDPPKLPSRPVNPSLPLQQNPHLSLFIPMF